MASFQPFRPLVLIAFCQKRVNFRRFRILLIISCLVKFLAILHLPKHSQMGVLYYNPRTLPAGSPDPLRPSEEVFSL